MQHWKRTTETANRLFEQGGLVDAREHYLQALALAQVQVGQVVMGDDECSHRFVDVMPALEQHLRLNQPHESADYLCAAHQRLLQASQEARLPQGLRDAALRHSGRTYTQLLSFIAEYGQYPRTERLLNRHGTGASAFAAQPDVAHRNHAYGIH